MITQEQFEERIKALYQSQQSMCREKKWKSGRRAGMVRREKMALQFTERELYRALSKTVGLNCIACPYCSAPIDILSLTLDHIIPRSAGGEMSLANLDAICRDCNQRKGEMTHEGFKALMQFSYTLSGHDRARLLSRLKAAHHGARQRFFRGGTEQENSAPKLKLQPPPTAPALDFDPF